MQAGQDHDLLVKELIDYFVSKKLEVRFANYRGYERPFVIKRHQPDILAIDTNGLGYIGEAKIRSEFSNHVTREQFQDFPTRIMKNGRSAGQKLPFYIAVPQGCESLVKQTFDHFEIAWKENISVLEF